MPSSINGVGTTYYGKRNLRQREGRCDSCGRDGVLSSYDTTLYFIFFFIPIIPLGKKRILDYCGACTRHRALSLEDWEKLKSASVVGAIEEFRTSPGDMEKVREVLGAFAGLLDREGLKGFVPEFLEHHGRNAEALSALGDVQAYLSEWADAEQSYHRALDMDRNYADAREGLARVYLHQNRPEDAEPLLEHIIDRGEPDKVGLLYAVAEGWQARGDHRRALLLFDQCQAIVPQLRSNKEFNKARALSEKHRDSGKVIKAKARKQGALAGGDGGGRDMGGRIARYLFPAMAAAGLIAWAVSSVSIARNREVLLVNGLSKPYQVSLNGGTPVTLPPGRRVPARVPEGYVRVEVPSGDYRIDPVTVAVRTNFFTRPFTSPVMVINPDQTALFTVTDVQYSAEGIESDDGPGPVIAPRTGEPLHIFPSVNYAFEKAPATIKMSKSSGLVTRTQLDLVDTQSPWTTNPPVLRALNELAVRGGKPAAARLVRARAGYDPDRSDIVTILASLAPLGEFRDFASPYLAERPVRLEFHRVYQQLAEKDGQTTELQEMYGRMLAADPEDSDLQYLLGRVMGDPDQCQALFRRAVSGTRPSAHAYMGLGYNDFANGHFEEAYANLRKASELNPELSRNWSYVLSAAIASKRYDDAIRILEAQEKENRNTAGLPGEFVYVCSLKGDTAGAERAIEKACTRIRLDYGDRAAGLVREALEQERQLASGDWQSVYRKWEENRQNASSRFFALLMKDDIEGALQAVSGEELDASGNALAAVALHRAGQSEKARSYFDAVIKALETDGFEEREMARALQGKSTLPPEKIARLPILPEDKMPLLLLLGEYQPENRPLYWSLARQLNYDRRGHHQLLARYLAP